MILPTINKQEFGEHLNQLVYPATPIRSIEHLQGREKELDRIEKALMLDGRNIFIYGDRGVGKTSLAATAAAQYQSADSEPIQVACSSDATFATVIANIAYEAIKANRTTKTKSIRGSVIELKYLKFNESLENVQSDLKAEITAVVDAVNILTEVAAIHSEKPIVLIDEFDRIDPNERLKFADLVKQLGDRKAKLKIIFTGVGKTLLDLLGAHDSAIRQLDTIMLPKLPWDARYEIVNKAMQSFGLEINQEILIRIAAVSDGFPSYIHKIAEKILWAAYEDINIVNNVSSEHFNIALNDAINESFASFSQKYERVFNQRNEGYEEVLWSTADSDYLKRYLDDMYASYEYIMANRTDREKLSYDKFCTRVRNLKSRKFGEILVSDKTHRGMYEYRESMLRGYVRMQAEAHGIQLIGVSKNPEQKSEIKIPASANRGYFASNPPQGVNFGRRKTKQ